MNVEEIAATARKLEENIERVFIGKKEVVRLALTAFFGEGSLLLDDAPGVGKTLLGRALAKSIDASFSRVQFTSDLLPSDVIGGDFYRPQTQDFQFLPGPIFANVVLADEINRTPPRTQSATLEAMGERQVTSSGKTYPLPRPFFVVATENPIEFEGAYPLPESELDRFFMRISIGYPDREAELKILETHGDDKAFETLRPVITLDEARAVQEATREIQFARELENYLLEIVDSTRRSSDALVGASPRASLALARAARVYAALDGRAYVVPDDVKRLVVPVLAHRVVLRGGRREDSRRANEAFIERVLASVETPGWRAPR